jgi:hypothetical protein
MSITPLPDRVEVIQSDRDAAGAIYGGLQLHDEAGLAQDGLYDDDEIVQAFALHRIRTVEECVAIAERSQVTTNQRLAGWNDACRHIARTILSTPQDKGNVTDE